MRRSAGEGGTSLFADFFKDGSRVRLDSLHSAVLSEGQSRLKLGSSIEILLACAFEIGSKGDLVSSQRVLIPCFRPEPVPPKHCCFSGPDDAQGAALALHFFGQPNPGKKT